MNRSPKGHSVTMLKFSQFVRSRLALQQTVSGQHLDAGVLTAFAEQRLSADERTNALTHLAHCPECREVLALISDAATEPRPQGSAFSGDRRRFPLWAWGSALAAALACLVVALIWPTSLIRPTPPHLELVTPPSAPPAPEVVSAPPMAKQSVPEPSKIRKRSLAKAAPPPAPISKTELDRTAMSQQPRIVIPSDTLKTQAIRTLPVPSASAMFQTESRIAPEKVMVDARVAQQPASLWRLSDPGTLQKSTDGGMTWQTVRLKEDSSPLYALSVRGPDVWVGGADATLLHSADSGVHWNKVPVTNGDFQMTGPITQIESRNRDTLRLTTRSGGHWITTDGGLHWRRE